MAQDLSHLKEKETEVRALKEHNCRRSFILLCKAAGRYFFSDFSAQTFRLHSKWATASGPTEQGAEMYSLVLPALLSNWQNLSNHNCCQSGNEHWLYAPPVHRERRKSAPLWGEALLSCLRPLPGTLTRALRSPAVLNFKPFTPTEHPKAHICLFSND